jgi:hypothetical protein
MDKKNQTLAHFNPGKIMNSGFPERFDHYNGKAVLPTNLETLSAVIIF